MELNWLKHNRNLIFEVPTIRQYIKGYLGLGLILWQGRWWQGENRLVIEIKLPATENMCLFSLNDLVLEPLKIQPWSLFYHQVC